MIELISAQFWLLLDLIREYGVFLTVLVNLYATLLVVSMSWKGWLAKTILDLYFAYSYLQFYINDPTTNNLNLLVNMTVFMLAHAYGFYKWRFRKEHNARVS